MKINVFDIQGKDLGRQIELPEVFFDITPNEHAIYLAVKQYLANQRQGTHSSKPRGVVSGSTRKLKRQKGTGTARAGSIKNPTFRKGGRMFGPEPRDYGIRLNKKVRSLARASALSYKAQNNNIIVVEDFSFDMPKTKEYVAILKNLGVAGNKVLHLLGENDKNVYLSARNLPKTVVRDVKELNTYEILNAQKLIFSESSVGIMRETFK
ncbi:MAG: 50S ribosomal protein L4 [Deltaproteobacteria bacterium]